MTFGNGMRYVLLVTSTGRLNGPGRSLFPIADRFQGHVVQFQVAVVGNVDGDLRLMRGANDSGLEALVRCQGGVGFGNEQVSTWRNPLCQEGAIHGRSF